MKTAVLSDIHANLFALEAVLQDCKEKSVDSYIFLGDLIMAGNRPKEVYDLLCDIKPLVWLKGDTDGWLDEIDGTFLPVNDTEKRLLKMYEYSVKRLTIHELEQIKAKKIFELFSFNEHILCLCHGDPYSHSNAIQVEPNSSVFDRYINDFLFSCLLCGHTHIPLNIEYKDRHFINFGSISMPSDGSNRAYYGIIDFKNGNNIQFHHCEFDFTKFVKDLKDSKYPGTDLILCKYTGV
jgi:putative phosphoesterase